MKTKPRRLASQLLWKGRGWSGVLKAIACGLANHWLLLLGEGGLWLVELLLGAVEIVVVHFCVRSVVKVKNKMIRDLAGLFSVIIFFSFFRILVVSQMSDSMTEFSDLGSQESDGFYCTAAS